MNDSKLPKAAHAGTLHIGALEVPCYVLADGRRVVTQTAALGALAVSRPSARNHCDETASFWGSNALKPYSGAVLTTATNAVTFNLPQGGAAAIGLDAKFLVEAARALDDADRAGALNKRHVKAVVAARTILHALAGVGLDALVDEACGVAKTNHAEDLKAYLDAALKAQARVFGAQLAESDAKIAALTATLDEKDEVELDLIGFAVATKSVAGRALAEARHLSDPAKQAIKLRKAEAQEKRDRRRGQSYIFTLRRPRPSEMAKGGAA